MHNWVTITRVFGGNVHEPTKDDMQQTLEELFSSADNEHPDSWLQCGSLDGPMYCISIFRSGYAVYTKYSDADMNIELERKRIPDVDIHAALTLWTNAVQGVTP